MDKNFKDMIKRYLNMVEKSSDKKFASKLAKEKVKAVRDFLVWYEIDIIPEVESAYNDFENQLKNYYDERQEYKKLVDSIDEEIKKVKKFL